MKQIVKTLIAVVITAVVVTVGFVLFLHFQDGKEVTEVENTITTTETEISNEIIKAGLVDIGELATEEYYYTSVESYDSSKKIGDFDIPFTTTSFIYSYDGIIKAGIDFTEVDVEKDDLKKLITVTLPKSKILSSEIDETSFKLYDEKKSIFNQLSVSNVNDTIIDLKAKAEEDAIAKGVLDRADKNACMILKNFLTSTFDVSDYTIKVVTE